jgi:CRISPR-associated endonuclease/helicase Cas3
MSTRDYGTFFSAAMGSTCRPYSYQSRLAELPCESRLISIPTGLGKTATVFLAWLWNRQHREPLTEASPRWPRRLVYCLPMRTLVEQTSTQVDRWIGNLVRSGFIAGNSPKVHILMGESPPPSVSAVFGPRGR